MLKSALVRKIDMQLKHGGGGGGVESEEPDVSVHSLFPLSALT